MANLIYRHRGLIILACDVADDDRRGRRGRLATSRSVLGDHSELVGSSVDEVWHDEMRLADANTDRARRPSVVRARLGLDDVSSDRTSAIIARRRPRERHRVTCH